jgi:O-antigen/teichoic acid export membrane protein
MTSAQAVEAIATIAPSAATLKTDLGPRPLSLRWNGIWTLAGNGVYALSQWLQIAILARLGSTRDVGNYALAVGLCTPVFMLSNLQLRPIQATDSQQKYRFSEYLGLRVIASSLALVLAVAMGAISFRTLEMTLLVTLVAAFRAFESISDIYIGLLQQRERMDRAAVSFGLKGALILLLFGTAYFLTHSVLLSASAAAVAQMITLLSYDLRAARWAVQQAFPETPTSSRNVRLTPEVSSKLSKLAWHAFPLGVSMMLTSLYGNLPRFALARCSGANAVGIYAALTYLANIPTIAVNAVGTAASPALAKLAGAGLVRDFRRLLLKLALFAGTAGAIGIAIGALYGQHLLALVYGAEYAHQGDSFIWCAVAAALSYLASMAGYGATAMARIAAQPWAVGCATVVLLAFSLLFVPSYGVTGAAISSAAAAATCLCMFFLIVSRRSNDPN